MYVPYTWIPQWWKIPKEIPRQIREFEAATEPLYQKKFERHNLLPHHHCSLRWLRSQEYFLIVKCDNKLGPTSIERKVYIKNACRDHIYQRDTYLYLPPALVASKISALKMKFGYWIKQHAKQLTIMVKYFLTKNLQDNFDPHPQFYGINKIHKISWAMIPIISCTVSLMHPVGVWGDSNFQEVAADIPEYFKDSNALKEKPTTMDLLHGTMLLTADAMSMYKKIHTRPALNQISQYFNVNKTKYRHLPLDTMIMALCLIMKNNILHFVDSHWLQLKVTAMVTPPAPTYTTVFYGVFEFFLF